MALNPVRRQDLYDKVWAQVRTVAHDAAPGAITPEVMTRICVDVTLTELLRAGSIQLDSQGQIE
jgi:hypothetical protein